MLGFVVFVMAVLMFFDDKQSEIDRLKRRVSDLEYDISKLKSAGNKQSNRTIASNMD